MAPVNARGVRPETYGILFLLFAAVLFLSHAPWIGLPYYWDEAGQFIPSALDILHGGAFIPHSTTPNIHPPAVVTYLAAVWSLAGYRPETTRCAMLLVSAVGLLISFLLAIELLRDVPGMPAFLAAALLCLSPVFFSQAILAQLDAPALLFTALALLLFLQERIRAAAVACIALVLVKETGVVAPLVFGLWLAHERRWRDAIWFLAPVGALGLWVGILAHLTGHWAGNAEFTEYNVYYPLHPVRLAINLARRLYYLLFANFHWIGAFAILFAWRTSRIFRARAWRIAWLLAAAHVAIMTAFGGGVLERYLLPVLPVLYAAMAAGLALFPRRPRAISSAALLAGVAAGNFINPPYPFPYEDNLAFIDFVHLQSEATAYLEHWYPGARVTTIWPLSLELSRPELGYVDRPIAETQLANISAATLAPLDWSKAQIVVAFSRNWDSKFSPLRWGPIERFWARYFGYVPNLTREETRRLVPLPLENRLERRGQWVDIYVKPALPRSGPQSGRLAAAPQILQQ
jgi:4-amino-4-deoxy-L-arabinose transferase-like glycosyltransferase